jgi:cation diffusion facilitator CzcD-associated flavoprotein CzcO
VIGVGNSGAEIATDLADAGASFVALGIRTTPFLVRRDTLGLPVQVLSHLMSRLPARAADTMARGMMRLAFNGMRRHGITQPGYTPYSANRVPVIDVGFAAAVKRGKVAVRPDIAAFTPSGVRFSDGQEEAFDLVVAATGFSSGLEQILPLPGVLAEDGSLRFASGETTPYPGLYFIGFVPSLRGQLYEANRSSRRLAKLIAAYLARISSGARRPAPR